MEDDRWVAASDVTEYLLDYIKGATLPAVGRGDQLSAQEVSLAILDGLMQLPEVA